MKDKTEDCYFYFDKDIPLEDDTLKIMCIKCHEKNESTKGWFWQGSVKGYGPFDFKCHTCGYFVHKHNKEKKHE